MSNYFNNTVFLNGRYGEYSQFSLGLLTNSLNFGTSVIDSIRIYKKEYNYYGVGLDYYMDRFIKSCKDTYFNFNYSKHDILKIIIKLLKKNDNIENPYFRLITFFGDNNLNIYQDPIKFNFGIISLDLKIYPALLKSKFSNNKRVPGIPFNTIKAASNYGINLKEYYIAKKMGYNSVIFIDTNDIVLESLSENIFIKIGDNIYTPEKGDILPGLNRKIIINYYKYFKQQKVIETKITKKMIMSSDEIIICGSATGLRNIKEIEGYKIGNGKYNEILKIKSIFEDIIFTEKKIGDIIINKFN